VVYKTLVNILSINVQVEFHPYFQQSPEFHEICRNAKIVLQAYSSMGGYTGNKSLLNDKVIVDIARRCSISPAQVLLRWAVQRNYGMLNYIVCRGKYMYRLLELQNNHNLN